MPTLLVVEDDDIVRMLTVEVLDELAYSVLEAEDAATALKILSDPGTVVDLMMTDVGLPDMNGTDLARRVRDERPDLPILFASGYADSLEVPEGMHSIGKPYSIDALRDKVQSILA
ncbi:response regulator [Pseudomonas entomophila]|jgi:CheY-like chemotaxis protein|uniref:response regulator n=1 Tax=Pseudomonas entomophila TaxID=312306 RepID=UPI0015E4459F|nr:response regulator [Pseudomonas entomophila]MBA1192938.1 response regulator [Pseudomonas entomophila]